MAIQLGWHASYQMKSLCVTGPCIYHRHQEGEYGFLPPSDCVRHQELYGTLPQAISERKKNYKITYLFVVLFPTRAVDPNVET